MIYVAGQVIYVHDEDQNGGQLAASLDSYVVFKRIPLSLALIRHAGLGREQEE